MTTISFLHKETFLMTTLRIKGLNNKSSSGIYLYNVRIDVYVSILFISFSKVTDMLLDENFV